MEPFEDLNLSRIMINAEHLAARIREGAEPRFVIQGIIDLAFDAGMNVDLGGLEGGEIVIRTGAEYANGGRSTFDLVELARSTDA